MEYLKEMKHIQNEILDFMGKNNLTISNMAEMSGLSDETIKYILNRHPKDCKATTLIKLAKAMGISIDHLAGIDE